MKHIVFAVVAAAALAVIGPRISQGQPKEAAASAALFLPSDYRATLPRSHDEAAREIPDTQYKIKQ